MVLSLSRTNSRLRSKALNWEPGKAGTLVRMREKKQVLWEFRERRDYF